MKQGEVWMTDFGNPSGPEQAGHRPAIILQDDLLNDALVTVIVVLTTTNLKRLLMPATLHKARLLHKMGELSPERFAEVQDAVLTALGL